VAETEALGTLS